MSKKTKKFLIQRRIDNLWELLGRFDKELKVLIFNEIKILRKKINNINYCNG